MKIPVGERIDLSTHGDPSSAHIFDQKDTWAIEAALLSGRPLLVLGEPGAGKSQFAKAAAAALQRAFESKVVDARTESRDLLWQEDSVARLAQAQLVGSLSGEAAEEAREKLDIRRFVTPGPLWWGFDWASACDHVEKFKVEPERDRNAGKNGVVVLIDEIDKAESDVPNGLLEALGTGQFKPPEYYNDPVTAKKAPLIIITSNEEQVLPGAFIRRCAVHELRLPEGKKALIDYLIPKGRLHFPRAAKGTLEAAAKMTADDREKAKQLGLFPLPGQAEYIDLLRAVETAKSQRSGSAKQLLDDLGSYFLAKHPELRK